MEKTNPLTNGEEINPEAQSAEQASPDDSSASRSKPAGRTTSQRKANTTRKSVTLRRNLNTPKIVSETENVDPSESVSEVNTVQPGKIQPAVKSYRKIAIRPSSYSQLSSHVINQVDLVKIIFLGGLNQIGKNMTAFECGNDIIIIDCGSAFPDGEMLGVDLVIPDFTYLENNIEKIRGLIVTHGHEDHIGAIPYLLKRMNIPIYSASLTIGLIATKLKEHRLAGSAKLNTIAPGSRFNLGCFDIEFIHINHSIPDSVALAIRTPVGIIIHTGDFKIDCTPARGGMIDLARFSELGREGVLALMADSTNADRPGYTVTEKSINESFEKLFNRAQGRRIVIATFASNIGRIQQIIDCAAKCNRKIIFSGRSMINYVTIAISLKYLIVPEGIIVDIDSIVKYSPHEIVLITTGSQGEPMSALYRMAFSEHKKIVVGEGDFIIISANPIPGNEKMVGSVVNELMRLGCEVIYESMYEVHVSGHACQEELKLIHGLTRPQFFIPVHGECKHLRKHAELAKNMGMSEDNIYIGETGDVVGLNSNEIKRISQAPAEVVLIDGIGVGDVGSVVLKDRKHLSQDGLIVMAAALSFKERKVLARPDILSRGFVYVKESEELMSAARKTALKSILSCFEQENCDWNMVKNRAREDLYKFFHDRTRRNPLILTILMEVKI